MGAAMKAASSSFEGVVTRKGRCWMKLLERLIDGILRRAEEIEQLQHGEAVLKFQPRKSV